MHSFFVTTSILLCFLLVLIKADECPEGEALIKVDYQAGGVPGEQTWDLFPEFENPPCSVIDDAFGYCEAEFCVPTTRGTVVFFVRGTFASGGSIQVSHSGMVQKTFASPTRERDDIYMSITDEDETELDPTQVKVTVAVEFGSTDELAVSGLDIHDQLNGHFREKIGGFNSISYADTTFITTMWITEGETYAIDPWHSATPETVKVTGVYYGAEVDEDMRIPIDDFVYIPLFPDSWASWTEEEKREHLENIGWHDASQFTVRDPTNEDDDDDDECQDDMSWSFRTKKGSLRSCRWIGQKPGRRCHKVGINGESANEACPLACELCH